MWRVYFHDDKQEFASVPSSWKSIDTKKNENREHKVYQMREIKQMGLINN